MGGHNLWVCSALARAEQGNICYAGPTSASFCLLAAAVMWLAASSSCWHSRWNLTKPSLPSVLSVMYCAKIPQSLRLNFSSPFSASLSPFYSSAPRPQYWPKPGHTLPNTPPHSVACPPLWVPACWTSRKDFSSPSSESCWRLQLASLQVFF